MKKLNILGLFMAAFATLVLNTSCDVEPTFYSQVTPETFFTSQDAVWDRFNRPFTHWRWYAGYNETYWTTQELGTDEFCLPTRGSDWYDGANYQKWHHHEFTDHMNFVDGAWNLFAQGVALSWDALEDLSKVDFDKLGFAPGSRESMLSQQTALVADFYLRGLDLFGGVPLYTTTQSEVKGRSTDLETFNFIDSLLTAAIPNLPKKTEMGQKETGLIHQAAGAVLQMRLYFNAESYIGQPMYDKAAKIAQDLINGVYGNYELDKDWTKTFGFTNDTSHEIIWSIPSEYSKLENRGYAMWGWTVPYNYKDYLGGLPDSGSNNGFGLQPGLDPTGKPYTFNLSGPYNKFNDKDIRKKNYVYYGDGKYEGMFIAGKLVNPVNPDWVCTGSREYAGQVLSTVDMVGYLSKVGTAEFPTAESLVSDIGHAEENSCIRIQKIVPSPTINEKNMMHEADIPVMRLAEAYYTLAECQMRAGDKEAAAKTINEVRARYFEGADPDPVTATNLDKYRMLDEWMMEFLGEMRRRTDLVRWNAYVTEDWWDHKATNNPNFNRFPLHYGVIGANNLLQQNPGY